MKKAQQKIIVIWLLGLGAFLIFGSYFILYPTVQNVVEKSELQKQMQPRISIVSWDSICDSWEPWKSYFNRSIFSPDTLVSLASKSSLHLRQLQVLGSGNEYRFDIEGEYDSIISFIQVIGINAPHWFFEQFELVPSSKGDLYFLKKACLKLLLNNTDEIKSQKIQKVEVKNKITKLISFRERKRNDLTLNPFENEKKKSIKTIPKKQSCRLPQFQIKGAIAGRVLHLKGQENKSIYKIGDYIGNYRINQIETKRVQLICIQDTISISL